MTSTIALIEWLDDKADDPAYFAHERQKFKAIAAKLSELSTLLETTDRANEDARKLAEKLDAEIALREEMERRFTTLLERCEKAEAEKQDLIRREFMTHKRAEKAEAALAEALVGIETMSSWRTHFAEQMYAAERQRDEALKAAYKEGFAAALVSTTKSFYPSWVRSAARAAGGKP